MDNREHISAVAILALGAVALGLGPILVRVAEVGPASAGFWRLALALPLIAPFAFRRGAPKATSGPNKLMIAAGVFFALDLAFWHYGIHLTSVANATVLANLTPIVVTAAGWWLFRERPARAFLIGLALGAAGAAGMALGAGETPPGLNPPLGDTLSILTTVWYACYFLAVRQVRRTHGAMAVMFWSTLAGAVVLPIAMFGLGEDILPTTMIGWSACAGLALMHLLGQGAIAWALGRLPAAAVAVVLFVQPVAAAALAWVLFAEAIAPIQGLGAVVALVGVAIAQWASGRMGASTRNESGRRPLPEPPPAPS